MLITKSIEPHLKKRITFILATKDRPEFFRKTLEMMRTLKSNNDELIVVDGSNDLKSSKVAGNYKSIIDKYILETDKSEGHAYNKGILIAGGRYIKCLTDDDDIYSDSLNKAIALMDKHNEVDILLCGGTRIINGKRKAVIVPPGANYGQNIRDIFDYGGCGIGLILRKSALAKSGLFNSEAFALDIDFITQCISKGVCVKFARIHLYNHLILEHSGTVRHQIKWQKDKNRIIRRYGLNRELGWRYLASDLYHNAPDSFKKIMQVAKKYKLIKKILKNMKNGNKKKFINSQNSEIWDGGLS